MGTKSRINISLVKKDIPVKNIVFTTNICYLWKGIDFECEILLKFIHFYEEFIAKKNQEVEFRQTKSDLAILMFKVTLSEGSSFTYTES